MSVPQAIMWCVVAVGLLASVRNPTAAALVVAWAIPQAMWVLGGSNLPIELYRVLDLCVVAVIFLKPEMTRWDWIILGIFAVMWGVYAAPLNAWTQWWILWALAILQFIAAIADAVESYWTLRRHARLWGRPPPGWFRYPGGVNEY